MDRTMSLTLHLILPLLDNFWYFAPQNGSPRFSSLRYSKERNFTVTAYSTFQFLCSPQHYPNPALNRFPQIHNRLIYFCAKFCIINAILLSNRITKHLFGKKYFILRVVSMLFNLMMKWVFSDPELLMLAVFLNKFRLLLQTLKRKILL